MRKIKITNSAHRDTLAEFGGFPNKSTIYYTLPDGSKPSNRKILKSPLDRQFKALMEKYGSEQEIADAIISDDPEIKVQIVGKYIAKTNRIMVNAERLPVYQAKTTVVKFDEFGKFKEEIDAIETHANVNNPETPISWLKKIPIAKAYNRFVFKKSYQIVHDTGANFEFLLNMAKELQDTESFVMLGGGAKGNEPLVFQEGGKPYRAFLEGRYAKVGDDDSFLLLIHLADHELKPLSTKP